MKTIIKSDRHKKQLLTLICILLLSMILIVPLSGCDLSNRNPVIDYGYFRVELNHAEGYAIVLELTELGEQQEILAVPMFVDGLPVRQIGREGGIWGGGAAWIQSANLRKLYVPHTVDRMVYSLVLATNSEIIVNLVDLTNSVMSFGSFSHTVIHLNFTSINRATMLPNVTFLYNYINSINQGYFWFDFVTCENLYLPPPHPIRLNHIFAGWYLEPEVINQWDNQMPQSANESLRLYARWQAIN